MKKLSESMSLSFAVNNLEMVQRLKKYSKTAKNASKNERDFKTSISLTH